jgi:hypothetical protein
MATPGEWYKSAQWYTGPDMQGTLGRGQDEIIGFIDNEVMDAHDDPFWRYDDQPTYEGEQYPPEWFHIDLTQPD